MKIILEKRDIGYLLLVFIVLFTFFVSGARQPIPSSDRDTWGSILNQYLNVTLDRNGTVRNITFGVNNETIDNPVDGWVRVIGALNVTSSTMVGSTNNIANGSPSFAAGENVTASGSTAVAMGFSTIASGSSSFSMGDTTHAFGNFAVAMGVSSLASGSNAFAMGQNAYAVGQTAIALGDSVNASGQFSFAQGFSSNASATNAIAMGDSNIASGQSAIAMGTVITVSGANSFGIGLNSTPATISTANVFVVMGGKVGIGTTAPLAQLHVVGEANITGISGDGSAKIVCILAGGNLGTCTSSSNTSGQCTCA